MSLQRRRPREVVVSDSDAVSSEEDESQRRRRSKKKSRRRELAGLLADQRKLATDEEIQHLRKYVNSVLNNETLTAQEEGGSGAAARLRRNAAVSRLPDMFGVVHGNSKSNATTRLATAAGQGALRHRSTTLDATFHATRWVLLSGTNRLSEWIQCAPHAATNFGSAGESAVYACSEGDGSASSSAVDCESYEEQLLKRFLHRRQQENDAAVAKWTLQCREDDALTDPLLDGVLLEDVAEYRGVLAWLQRTVAHCVPPLRETLQSLDNLGFAECQSLLRSYAETRCMVAVHDWWLLRAHPMPAERITEVVLVLCFAIVAWRREALVKVLRSRIHEDGDAALLRAMSLHPWALERLCPSSDASAVDPPQAFAALLQMLKADEERRIRKASALIKDATSNVALRRQEAKVKDFTQQLTAMQARIAAAAVELSEASLEEEIGVQLEVSRRLDDAVQAGVLLEDAVASEASSFLMESVLWTLPPTIPLQHREIEEALEKYLWNHPYALMDDELGAVRFVRDTRHMLLINIALRRAVAKRTALYSSLRKLEQELLTAVGEVSEDGVALPKA